MTAPFPTERSSGARTPGDRSQVARSLTYIELWDIVQPDVANASPHLRITRHPSQHGQYFPAERGVAPGPFPLGKTGGLIEAKSSLTTSIIPSLSFRWVKPAASLKPPCDRYDRRGLDRMFPLGKTGGLIEANLNLFSIVSAVISFRWVKPAASLKPLTPLLARAIMPASFRWVKPAASLKLGDYLTLLSNIEDVSAG